MSLYGSGRREGIVTVLLMVGLVALVHLFGTVQRVGLTRLDLESTLLEVALPALAGLLCYRFLRAQGRSRYAGFLAGTAYALSPWLTAMAQAPREQFAAALAPLALEATYRCDAAAQRRRWLPWAGLCLGAPFVGGASVIACLCAVLCAVHFGRVITQGELGERRALAVRIAVAGVFGVITAASLVWLDPFGLSFGIVIAPTSVEVLASHRSPTEGLDACAVMRLGGPVLLVLAALGIVRRQRHVSTRRWLVIGLAGGVPTLLAGWLPLQLVSQTWADAAMLPAASWWLGLLAITVLGAAGLDDFLDLPQRRRTAMPWLLAGIAVLAPFLPLVSAVPEREWPLIATILLLAALLPTWRRVGILHFKAALATVVVLALAVPALQVLLIAPSGVPPAMPFGEFAPAIGNSWWDELARRPWWHYSGLMAALAWACLASLSACLRNRSARTEPTTAKAAITKKARPPHPS